MGGGGSKSKTVIDVSTKSIVEAMTKNIMNCKSSGMVTQRFILSGSYNVIEKYRMVQNFKLSKECVNNAQNLNDLQASIANAIKAAAEAQGDAVFGALSSSKAEATTMIENEVKQVITNENITNMIDDVNALQESIISGNNNIVKEFSMEQTTELVMMASQEVLNQLKSVQAIQNQAESGTKSTQTNFISDIVKSITDMVTDLGLGYVFLLIVVVIVGGVVAVKFIPSLDFLSFSDEKNEVTVQANQGQPYQQMPYGQYPAYAQAPNQAYAQAPNQAYAQAPNQAYAQAQYAQAQYSQTNSS